MAKVLISRLSLFVVLGASAACTVHKQEIPDFSGPSGYALSLALAATPDRISQDGVSQSRVVATLRDSSGKAVPNAALQVLTAVNSSLSNFGTVSAPTVYTGSDGKATVFYTAPAASPFMAGSPSTRVSIYISPVGTDYQSATAEHVDILVTPPPVPVAGVGSPVASVTMNPASPKVGQVVLFDASASTAGTGHRLSSYYWSFGDSQTNDEHGSDASHVYLASGTYSMILGVVDDAGQMSSTFRTIVVTP
jgi:PKD repeat protein